MFSFEVSQLVSGLSIQLVPKTALAKPGVSIAPSAPTTETIGLRVMLLTGDRPEAAGAVAVSLGLGGADIKAGVRPDNKATAIQQLQSQRRNQVAMVGDGINDAPALSQADVGIALHAGQTWRWKRLILF